MRTFWNAYREYETPRRKSKNRRAKCEFCPTPGANSMILDCDRIVALCGLHGVINDCIVVEQHGILHVAVVEIKGRAYSAGHTRSQLVAGANLVMDMLEELKLKRPSCIHLVVVAPEHRSSQRTALRHSKARVRGKTLRIRTARCGVTFSQIIRGR